MENKIFKMMNDQMNQELLAACRYQNMASLAEKQNMKGFSAWLLIQSDEELSHFRRFYKFLISVGHEPVITEMNSPEIKAKKVTDFPAEGHGYERAVTASIQAILQTAFELKEYKAIEFLQRFVTEQIEEEEIFSDLIASFALAAPSNLYILDCDLGKRVSDSKLGGNVLD